MDVLPFLARTYGLLPWEAFGGPVGLTFDEITAFLDDAKRMDQQR